LIARDGASRRRHAKRHGCLSLYPSVLTHKFRYSDDDVTV
jgi:hypothetical protein